MKRLFLLLLVLMIPVSSVMAQGDPPPPPTGGPVDPSGYTQQPDPQGQHMGRGDSEIRRQLEQIKIWQMTKEMNLPTNKAEKFFPLYNHYNDEMRTTTAARRQAVKSLDSAIGDHVGDAEIGKQVKRVLSLDNELAAIHVKFIQSLGDILTPTEVARYMVFEQRFDREIRERIRMMMQRGMRGRGR